MVYEVIVSQSAERDLDDILAYIIEKLKNIPAAVRLVAELDARLTILETSPLAYEESRDANLRTRGYRRMPLNNYIVLYSVDDVLKQVYIARMFYARQDYPELI